MECRWIMYFGNYCFITDCGHSQGKDIKPKQKTCICGKRIKRFIQDMNGNIKEVNNVSVRKGHAYYS